MADRICQNCGQEDLDRHVLCNNCGCIIDIDELELSPTADMIQVFKKIEIVYLN